MVDAAQRTIDKNTDNEEEKQWLQELLNILKEKNYATIKSIATGKLVDVSKIAYTYEFASFFDVFNHIRYFDLHFTPIKTTELKNTYARFSTLNII